MPDSTIGPEPTAHWQQPRTLAAIAIAWIAYGFLFLNQNLLINTAVNYTGYDPYVLTVRSLAPAFAWIAASVGIFILSDHFPLRGRFSARNALVHLLAAVLAAAADVAFDRWLGRAFNDADRAFFIVTFARQLNINLFLYVAVAATAHLLAQMEITRQRELRGAQLETRLVSAQLDVLKMQIQPHFLFNTLNAISQLFHEDPDRAEVMITRLGELLRTTLEYGSKHHVRLDTELDFVERYLDIQQVRFQDQLSIRFDIDPAVRDAAVPPLILQPIVENSIRHGIIPSARAGTLTVQARRAGDVVLMQVLDDGVGLPASSRDGIGLANISARLHQLYGAAGTLTLAPAPNGGTCATIELPYQPLTDE